MGIRKSYIEVGKIYFWTATINSWHKLLQEDSLKEVIASPLKHLSVKKKIGVHAFVIMLNHIHLIWQLLGMKGKEKPPTSFLKFTAHAFKKYLTLNNTAITIICVDAINKDYEFRQRDSWPFELLNKKTLLQKMDYIHNNPNTEYWKLGKEPTDYYYSPAKFYETGIDEFGFLILIADVI